MAAKARSMDSLADKWELGVENTSEISHGRRPGLHLGWSGSEAPHSFAAGHALPTDRATWAMEKQEAFSQRLPAPLADMYIQPNEHLDGSDDMDFVLQGVLYIDWTGTVSTNNAMGLQTGVSQIPEPASYLLILMMSGLGLFIRRRFGL